MFFFIFFFFVNHFRSTNLLMPLTKRICNVNQHRISRFDERTARLQSNAYACVRTYICTCVQSATNWHGINETGSSYMKRDETTQDKARRRSSFKVSMKDPCSCPVVQRPYHLKAEPYTHLNTTDHGESFAKNQFAQLGGSSLIW